MDAVIYDLVHFRAMRAKGWGVPESREAAVGEDHSDVCWIYTPEQMAKINAASRALKASYGWDVEEP